MKSGMPEREIVISDEKLFTVEAQEKHQNNIVLLKHSIDIPKNVLSLNYCQKSESVMVWAAVSKFCERCEGEHKCEHQ